MHGPDPNPDAQLVGGVWLPKTETHLRHEMLHGKKRKTVQGKATYQHHKLTRAMAAIPVDRRGLAIDIGAHVGLWSMWLVQEFEHLHAFEPVPLHARLFQKNLEGREYSLHRCALGEKAGMVDIEIPDETTGNAHIAIGRRHPGTRHVKNPDSQKVVREVEICRLDDFNFERVDFIKIDVEGFERQVIAGGEQTIRGSCPVMVVEQKGNESAYGDGRDAAVKLLMKWGARKLDCIAGDWIMGW